MNDRSMAMRMAMRMVMCMILWSTCALGGLQAADWRADTDSAIIANRTTLCSIRLVDAAGTALPAGVPVRVRMTRSAFNFGTALNRKAFAAETDLPPPYLARIPELFNCVVMESGHKWGKWVAEEERPLIDAARQWILEQDLRLRGHTMIWGVLKYKGTIPDPWRRYIADAEDGHQEELADAILEHIDTIGAALPEAVAWDVINEPFSEQHIFDYLGASSFDEQADLMATWLHRAHAAAPQAQLVINEFGIITNPDGGKARRLLKLAAALRERGAPLHGIGVQGHHWSAKQQPSVDELQSFLDRCADLDLTVELTEWDTTYRVQDDGANPEAVHAEHFERSLRVFYAHPAVRSVMLWGYWDGKHWRGNAALFRKDWSPKPAHAVWQELVLGQWRTDVATHTDADGRIRVQAHHGEHVLQLQHDGRAVALPLTIDASTASRTLTLPD